MPAGLSGITVRMVATGAVRSCDSTRRRTVSARSSGTSALSTTTTPVERPSSGTERRASPVPSACSCTTQSARERTCSATAGWPGLTRLRSLNLSGHSVGQRGLRARSRHLVGRACHEAPGGRKHRRRGLCARDCVVLFPVRRVEHDRTVGGVDDRAVGLRRREQFAIQIAPLARRCLLYTSPCPRDS